MVYLYAGLGIAMLSGIMAVFEMGLAVTGQSFLSSPVDRYDTGLAKDTDKKFIKSLYGGWDEEFDSAESALEPCNNLQEIKEFQDYNWDDGPNNSNSCVTHNGNHRIIVQQNPDSGDEGMKYRVYSCLGPIGQQCTFEKGLKGDG